MDPKLPEHHAVKDVSGEALPKPLPFGAVMGHAPGGVPAYSCDENTMVEEDDGFYLSHGDNVFFGYKYQCVEFARRWLVQTMGLTFASIPMAYHIFELPVLIRLADKARLPVLRVRNGANVREHPEAYPRLGSVIMWEEGGFFRWTGHVAIVTEATDTYIRVAEQNVLDAGWEGKDYARELRVERGEDGSYTVLEAFKRSHILGWLHLPPAEHEAQIKAHGVLPAAAADRPSSQAQ